MWSGRVFNCKSADNSIVLLHSRYCNTSMISSCNGGAVVGQGLYVEDDQYTSQLNVTINNYSSLIERDITCAHDDGSKTHIVGCHTLSIAMIFLAPTTVIIQDLVLDSFL